MRTIEELEIILNKRVLKAKPSVRSDIFDKCVEMNKLTRIEATNLENGTLSLDTLDSNAKLYWILKIAIESNAVNNLGKLEDYFTDFEINDYEFLESHEDNDEVEYPLVFENVENLTPYDGSRSKQYGFYLTVKDIKKYHAAGVLQVIPELQRGGKKNSYDELKTSVNKKRVAEIASKISSGKYYFDELAFNLVDDDDAIWEYNEARKRLYIQSGLIITLDGNHRAFSCEMIGENNVYLDSKFHISFTILNKSEAKAKIDQVWNREPVSKSQIEYMKNSNSNKILDMVLRSEDLDDTMKQTIITSSDQRISNQGAYVYKDISKAIEKYYNGNKIETREEQRELADWLVNVLNRVAFNFKDDIKNFKNIKKLKWNVHTLAMYGFIYLSEMLVNTDNWKIIFDKCLNEIDFNDIEVVRASRSDKAKINRIEKIFKEVYDNANV